MQLAGAYLVVVLIWSTTPLGIVWSSETVTPTMAVLLRMLIAWVLGYALIKLFRIQMDWHGKALRFYSYSAIGVAGGMFLCYMGARSVPSGMLSLIYGFAPIFSGLFGQWLLNEKPFSGAKKCALVLSFTGLFVVCYDKIFADYHEVSIAFIDLFCVFSSVVLFSLSAVLVKTLNVSNHPLSSTVGTLSVSLPIFFILWWAFDGDLANSDFEMKSVSSIIYLGVFGSLFGFMAYFYVLKRLPASTVSLVTLMTPAIAIFLGSQLNNEVLTFSLLLGSGLVLIGLFLYFFGDKVLKRVLLFRTI